MHCILLLYLINKYIFVLAVRIGPNHWTKTKTNFRVLGSKPTMALPMTRIGRGEKFDILEIILALDLRKEKKGYFLISLSFNRYST